MWRFLALVGLVGLGGCPMCRYEVGSDPHHAENTEHRARRAAELAVARCLPAGIGDERLTLGFDGVLIACVDQVTDNFALGGPLACWRVDPNGDVWPRPPLPLPGRGRIMAVEAGKVGGFIVGPSSWEVELEASRFILAVSTDRRHAVVSTAWHGIDFYVYDLATGALSRHIVGPSDDDNDDEPWDLAYVGDRIYRIGRDHGVTAWLDDGSGIPIETPARYDSSLVVVGPDTIALPTVDRLTARLVRPEGTLDLDRLPGDQLPHDFVTTSPTETAAIEVELLRTYASHDLVPDRTVLLPFCR